MFFRKKYWITGIFAVLCVFCVGCSLLGGQKTPQTRPSPLRSGGASKTLLNLFPQRLQTQWTYRSPNKYIQIMRLRRRLLSQDQSQVIQQLTGTFGSTVVDRVAPKGVFNLQYIFSGQEVREKIVQADPRFPHRIPDLILIRMPLTKGNTWTQQVNLAGKTAALTGEIIDVVQPRNGITVYKVRYRVPMEAVTGGVYEETRHIQRGMGVTRFVNNSETTGEKQTAYEIVQLRQPDDPTVYDNPTKPRK